MKGHINIFKEFLYKQGVLTALIIIIGITAILNPRFLNPYNLLTLSSRFSVWGLLAIAETFVIITGGIDLSVGSLTSLTCVLTGWFIVHGFGVTGGVIAVLLVGTGVGLLHGFFITKLRIQPFIITLGTFAWARGLASAITHGWPIEIPGRAGTLINQVWYYELFGFIPMPVVILLIATFIGVYILNYTITGRHVYAVGGDVEAARRAGINVNRTIVLVYVVSALLGTIVGILLASRLTEGNANVGWTYELYAIAAAVIGGVSLFGGEGSILKSLVGAGIITVIWNSLVLLRISAFWNDVAVGVILVIAVTYDTLQRRRKVL